VNYIVNWKYREVNRMKTKEDFTATPPELREMLEDLYNALEEEIVKKTVTRQDLDTAYFTLKRCIEARERR